MTDSILKGRRWTVDPETGCWLWNGYINPQGYGVYCHRGRLQKAHRAAWQEHTGLTLSKDVPLHHKCHTKRCMNPDHLEPITSEKHGIHHRRELAAQLTEEQVLEVRRLAAIPGTVLLDLAEQFGVDRSIIDDIVMGWSWKEIGGHIGRPIRACIQCGKSITHRKRDAKYCGGACRTAWWMAHNPEKAQAIRAKYNAERRQARAA